MSSEAREKVNQMSVADDNQSVSHGLAIAIIGMAGRFPGADTLASFWQNLRNGVEAISFLTPEELIAAGEEPARLTDPNYVPATGRMAGVDQFDAPFFGLSPRDAMIMDPQHRHFLEVAWTALEDAGYATPHHHGATGVFAGSGETGYLLRHLATNPDLMRSVGDFLIRHTGNDKDFLATRVSYLFNLRGPSLNIQTACSTSLVAIHLACQSLLNGECDLALAGAVTLLMPPNRGYLYQPGEILSPDGHCRPFDADAQGTIFGSGLGIVVLKRLADALADGDSIRAVIKGSAINNDGSLKAGYLAPSVDGQAAVVAEALDLAGVSADTIGYVEAHGTGTPIGDPIEIAALTQAFRQSTARTGYCAIGSLKSNIGHLDTAAGVASLIKTVLALQHRQIPPSLHYQRPNPQIDFAASPFVVNAQVRDWPAGPTPRRAGVSSLGVGGTNAHVILEEAPPLPPGNPGRPWQLLVLSAHTPTALDQSMANLATHLAARPAQNLADVAYTLQVGRTAFAQRRLLVAEDVADAVAVLQGSDPRRLLSGRHDTTTPRLAFLFPGGGAQYAGMGADLYHHEPLFRAAIDECADLLAANLGLDLRTLLYPPAEALARADEQLRARPSLALPALFVTEYALARLLTAWSLRPEAMIGHSLGEYTAACLAGVFSLADALALVALRGRLFEQLPPGGMLSVALPEAELRLRLSDALSLAAVNGPSLAVVSGPLAAIEAFETTLIEAGVECRRLQIDAAAHSAMLEPILAEFAAFVSTIALHPPQQPFISNLTGSWATAETVTSPDYWVQHLRQTVRFADGLSTLLGDPGWVLLEVGPGRTLTILSQQHPRRAPHQVALSTMRHPRDQIADQAFLLAAVGRLWLTGIEPDWSVFHGSERRRRLPLPTYPFEHQRYWIEPGLVAAHSTASIVPGVDQRGSSRSDLAEHRLPVAVKDWLYQPSWRRLSPLPPADDEPTTWLLLGELTGLSKRLADYLRHRGHRVTLVGRGQRFSSIDDETYIIHPAQRAHYDELFRCLRNTRRMPRRIVHLWNLSERSRLADLGRAQELAFHSLISLAQAISSLALDDRLALIAVTNNLFRVAGESTLHPEKALILGPISVIPSELPELRCRAVDLSWPAQPAHHPALIEHLAAELMHDVNEPIVALRGPERWSRDFEPLRLEERHRTAAPLRPGGVYLITGGLGGLGLAVADYLARAIKARLVLVGRSGLPERSTWARWLDDHTADDATAERIRQVMALEAAGAEVLIVAADVTDRRRMTAVMRQVQRHFGELHGVFHAAGSLNDGLLHLKDRATTEEILAAKVAGTLVLEEVVARHRLDLLVLFSSVSAFLGLPGQVDYAAANAFLDAYAQARGQDTSGRVTVAIDWSAWREVGMVADRASRQSLSGFSVADAFAVRGDSPGSRLQGGGEATSGWFERRGGDGQNEIVLTTTIGVDRWWLLDEHRVKGGSAVLPGTAYLELMRAALSEGLATERLLIRELFIIAPLAVGDDEERELRLRLRRRGQGYECSILSRALAGAGLHEWQEHARAEAWALAELPSSSNDLYDLAELQRRCDRYHRVLGPDESSSRQEEFLTFGPRWRNVRQVWFGQDQALAELALPAAVAGEVERYGLHPALLDTATGFALPLVEGYATSRQLYVPAAYHQVRLHRSLPAHLYCLARLRRESSGVTEPAEVAEGRGRVVMDLLLLDEQGAVVAEIERFTMRAVEPEALLGQTAPLGRPGGRAGAPMRAITGTGAASVAGATLAIAGTRAASAAGATLAVVDRDGLTTAAGLEALEWILLGRLRPQVIVSARDPRHRLAECRLSDYQTSGDGPSGGGGDDPSGGAGLAIGSRPNLPVAYQAPGDEIETSIAAIWQELLGVAPVGRHDDLFALGGHSLIAIRIFNRIERAHGVKLSLATLFDAPTVAQLAQLVRAATATEGVPPLPVALLLPDGSAPGGAGESMGVDTARARPVNRADRSLVKLRSGGERQPLFLIHGGGGGVLNFRELVGRLRPDRPIYALQARGLDGGQPAHRSVEEMALAYLTELRAVQPTGPYIIGGYCLGGLVAWEMARLLVESGERLSGLLLLETYAPGYEGSWRFQTQWYLQRSLVHLRNLGSLGPTTFAAYARRRMQTIGWRIGQATRTRRWQARLEQQPTAVQSTVPVEQGDHYEIARVAISRYRPPVYPGRPLLVIANNWGFEWEVDPHYGWSGLTSDGLEVIKVPGDHGSLFETPYVAVLAERLQHYLDRLQAGLAPAPPTIPTPVATTPSYSEGSDH